MVSVTITREEEKEKEKRERGEPGLAHMGPGQYGPWPIWALAHMGLAHMGYVQDFYI